MEASDDNIARNRDEGMATPPVWSWSRKVYHTHGSDTYVITSLGRVVEVCSDWEACLQWLRTEEPEWRWVSTDGNRWHAHRYMGGSGPCGNIVIYVRPLYNSHRKVVNG